MGILLAVDYDQNLYEGISEDDQVVFSNAVFKLAKSHPENFVQQLSWKLSDKPDDLFFNESALGPAACFHSRIWLESWLKTLGKCEKTSLQFLTGKMGGQTIIAIPLTVKPGKFVTCVEFAGQNVSDYNIPIVHQNLEPYLSQPMLNAIVQQIAELFPDADCVDFRKVLLDEAAPCKDEVQWQEDAELTHLCALTGDWEHDLSQFIGKSTKKKLKKKLRKLETFGKVTFEDVTAASRRAEAGEKLINWKAHQLKDLGAASVYNNTGFCDFLRATIVEDNSGMVRLFSMNINDEPIALIYALCFDDYWFLYQMSYTSEEPGKYSPGYQLLLHVMEIACHQNVRMFDFGWGNEAYKHRFATQSKPLYNAFCPLTTKGKLALRLCNSKMSAKNFVKTNRHLQSAAKFGLRTIGKFQTN
ncbi:MAG: GNAT family N-acetyltransferase [Hyphomicrobiales bacterium]